MMEFRILGHLEVLRDGQRLELGGPKQRAVLAALILEAGHVVSIDRLCDQLWTGEPPAGRDGTLHAYVSHLRRVLEPDRAPGTPGRVLVTRGSGYLLRVEPDQLDAWRFERLAEQGRQALAVGQFERAEELLAAALALWRGQALADVLYEPFAEAEAARLEERRTAVLEDRIDAALARGRHCAAVAELEQLVRAHPFRERLRGQLMLALYRSGRQAEALRTYQAARRLLRDELGAEPGPALEALERAILLQEPALDWHPAGEMTATAAGSGLACEEGTRLPAREAAPAVFVDRVAELTTLEAALAEARTGRGRVVLVGGEPGIGKTRLAEELAGRAARADAEVVWGRCYEGEGAPAFWPWVQIVRALVDTGDPKVLREALATRAAELAQIVPEVGQVLPGLQPPAPLPAVRARVHLFEALSGFLRRLTIHRPLVLILDDLHWADPASLHLLALFASEPQAARVLLLACYRDTEVCPGHQLAETLDGLGSEPRVKRLALGGLSRDDIAQLMAELLGWEPRRLLVNAIHDRTGGNPFFVAELARLVQGEGSSDDAKAARLGQVPAGVRYVIRDRLTRLPQEAAHLLQTAAVLGREFELGLLSRVSGLGEERASELMESVLSSRMVEASAGGLGRYRFSHGLIRDTLYEGLPAFPRRRLHRRTAEVLEEANGPGGGVHSVEIAQHFWEAGPGGACEQAFEWALRASDWASSRGAYEQAEEQLLRAGEVFDRLPAGPGRAQRDLALQLRLSTLLGMTKGYGAPQVGHACHRARELCRVIGDADQLLWSLVRLGAFHSVRLDFASAQEVGGRLLQAAQDGGDPRFVVAGHLRLGVTAFHQGRLAVAKGHLDQAMTCSETLYDPSVAEVFVQHPAVMCHGYQALIHWLLGEERQATMLAQHGLAFARRLDQPYSLTFALFLAAWLGAFRGRAGVVRRRAEELRLLADEHGFRLLAASARVLRGWACAEQVEAEEGATEAADGLAALAGTGGRMMRPFFLGLLAQAYRRAGRLEDGLNTLEEALAEVETAGDRFGEAELHRLEGEFLAELSPDRRAHAEASLHRALYVARAQQAIALERRARTSLTRVTKQAATLGRGRRTPPTAAAGKERQVVVSAKSA